LQFRKSGVIVKPVIKSMYADMTHENAKSGLSSAATSRISPGADQKRLARAYPIDVADRITLGEWLTALREPRVGDFQLPQPTVGPPMVTSSPDQDVKTAASLCQ
jgi:hypothetical protein